MSLSQEAQENVFNRECFDSLSESGYSEAYAQGDSLEEDPKQLNKCPLCKEKFTKPVVLSCLHVYDSHCLKPYEKLQLSFSVTECPECGFTSDAINHLVPFNMNAIDDEPSDSMKVNDGPKKSSFVAKCSLCTDNADAVSKCIDCAGTLCVTCLDVHKRMKMFSSHNFIDLTEDEKSNPKELARKIAHMKPVNCNIHREHVYMYFCYQCNLPLCEECLRNDHNNHVNAPLESATHKVSVFVSTLVDDCKKNRGKLMSSSDALQQMISELQQSREQNKGHIEEVCNDWKAAIDEIKEEFLQKNRELHNELELVLINNMELTQSRIDHIDYVQKFVDSYLPRLSPVEYARVCKSVLSCLEGLCKFQLSLKALSTQVPFMDDRTLVRDVIRSHYGFFGHKEIHGKVDLSKDPVSTLESYTPTSMNSVLMSNGGRGPGDLSRYNSNSSPLCHNSILPGATGDEYITATMAGTTAISGVYTNTGLRTLRRPASPNTFNGILPCNLPGNGILTSPDVNHGLLGLDFPVTSASAMGPLSALADLAIHDTGLGSPLLNHLPMPIDSRTVTPGPGNMFLSGLLDDIPNTNSFPPGQNLHSSQNFGLPHPGNLKPTSVTNYNPNPNPPFPNRQGRCQAMTVRTRWGSLGPGAEQMNSPHGFCLGFDEDIVVADTQNHRILVFTKGGVPRTNFGIAGREEGQLWYPRKVTILRNSQKYVVCDRGSERSRMQVFTRSGHFLKKINIRYIDIVAGLAINSEGHIIAVDSVSPSVFTINEQGDLVRWFDCGDCMREPSDIAINQNEYYICDFKGHCVAVFNDVGTFLRRIGNDAITNFPNGIDVSDYGDVLIGDSHGNRFHVAVFDRNGEPRGEFECPNLKVSRCCGLKITSEGFLVTLAKNNNQVFIIDTLYIN